MLEALNALKVAATFYLCPGRLGRFEYHVHPDEIPPLYRDHEIGCHSWTHSEPDELADDASHEIIDARFELRRRFDQPVDAFAYPYGKPDPRLGPALAAAGFVWARTGQPTRADALPRASRYEMPISGSYPVPPQWIDRLINRSRYVHLYAHSYALVQERRLPRLTALIHWMRTITPPYRFVVNTEFFAATLSAAQKEMVMDAHA